MPVTALKNNIFHISPAPIILIMISALAVFSCSNDVREVREITAEDTLMPAQKAEDITIIRSDSAVVNLKAFAPSLVRYIEGEDPYNEFPDGIYVVTYREYPDTTSTIRADYAINYEDQHLWIAKGDVVAVNEQKEQLNTEELYWDERKEIIYTEKKVRITTANEIIFGEGMEADQYFNRWQILKPSGPIKLREEDESKDEK